MYDHHELWHFGQATHNFICKSKQNVVAFKCATLSKFIFVYFCGVHTLYPFLIFFSFGPLIFVLGHTLFSFFNMGKHLQKEKLYIILQNLT